MSDILEEFDKYISSNKEILSVLPVNTKKNRAIYLEKVLESLEAAEKIKQVIWKVIEERYKRLTSIEPSPKIKELTESIKNIKDVDLFNELNTPYENLGFDRINHNLSCFYEANLDLLNENIKLFVTKFKTLGIELSEDDFTYSIYANQYMRVFLEEYDAEKPNIVRLKKKFEEIYWKCPDVVTHIELNFRHLYNINSKKIEKDLKEANDRFLSTVNLDKIGLVKRHFDLNEELIKVRNLDAKAILDRFINGKWKIKDFNDKEMHVLYDRLYAKDYYAATPKEQAEINTNFDKLLKTLQEYNMYMRYKYIIDNLKEKKKNIDSFKGVYESKLKELHKKEQSLLKENELNQKLIKRTSHPLFKFFKKKMEKKIYDFPVASNLKIKEIKNLYSEIDEQLVNKRIAEFVDDTCSIKYMFKIAVSFYTYTYELIKKHYEEDTDVDVEKELQDLVEFIRDEPYKVMLNNIKSIE